MNIDINNGTAEGDLANGDSFGFSFSFYPNGDLDTLTFSDPDRSFNIENMNWDLVVETTEGPKTISQLSDEIIRAAEIERAGIRDAIAYEREVNFQYNSGRI